MGSNKIKWYIISCICLETQNGGDKKLNGSKHQTVFSTGHNSYSYTAIVSNSFLECYIPYRLMKFVESFLSVMYICVNLSHNIYTTQRLVFDCSHNLYSSSRSVYQYSSTQYTCVCRVSTCCTQLKKQDIGNKVYLTSNSPEPSTISHYS